MNDAEYIDSVKVGLMRRFPVADGWRVHAISSRALIPVRWIPAFASKHAAAPIRRDVVTSLGHFEKSPMRRADIMDAPHTRDGDGVSLMDWRGEVEFVWEGSPIIVFRGVTLDLYGKEIVFSHMVERDHPGFERMVGRLVRFAKDLEFGRDNLLVSEDGPRRRPKASRDDVILPVGMRDDIRGSFEGFLKARAAYAEAGLAYRRGFLFSGAPGCGKSLTIRAMTANTEASVVLVELTSSITDWEVKRAFQHAMANAPCLLILEDLDHIVEMERVSLSYVLNLLDGMDTTEGVLVVATTNHPEKLDPALVQRPSRFDRVWRFGLPGRDERLALLERRLEGKVSKTGLEDAAARSGGFTMAYVQEIAASALLRAINEGRPVGDADIRIAVDELRRQVRDAARPVPEAVVQENMGFAAKESA